MIIGIDASRAFENHRTGIEEYSYQVIKHLIPLLKNDRVILYIRNNQKIDLDLPENWKVKIINFSYLWTQIGLSLEILFHSVDTLFIPAHVVPCVHPKNTIVTIHGLEYEFCPKAYSWLARIYMRWSIKKSCQWTKKIIAVSENTKRDLINLYKVPEGKIEVVYEGYSLSFRADPPAGGEVEESNGKKFIRSIDRARDDGIPYLLFIGRLEERKNIGGIINAFEILKEKYKIPHKLVLAGGTGHNYKNIKLAISSSHFTDKIIETGFVSEEEKWELLKNADVFLFPTFYEGFGLPILEAQSAGVPVIASNNSSIPEVVNIKKPPLPLGEDARRAGEGNLEYKENLPHPIPLLKGEGDSCSALLVNLQKPSEIAEAAYKLISDKTLRNDIINRGYENVKRFSWKKCAEEIAKIIKN
jgi:glycosyltransferase involved in cell wall biosynthesis